MYNRKRIFAAVCVLLCALLLTGFASAAASAESAEEPLAGLHVEKNGKALDLTLKTLKIEDGNLAISIGIDGITGWKDEEPPKLQVIYREPSLKLKSDLFTAATVQSLPENAKNYKMSTKFPVDRADLPDQILILVGEDEPLVFWEKEAGASPAAPESSAAAASLPAKLRVEKNGKVLDLTLEELAVEDDNLLVSVGIDGITAWKDEEPPKLRVVYYEPVLKFKTSLFSASTVEKLSANTTGFKTTMTFPYDGTALPDQILIEVGGDELLVFWENPEPAKPAASAKPSPTPSPTPKPTPSPTPASQLALDNAKSLFAAGNYYAAALAARDCANDYPSTKAECNALTQKIADALKSKEPKTGELERHFPFYGMNCVRATAQSGPFEMKITDVDNSSQFVRFYVRQYETSEIYLPSSHYYVEIKMGDIWFGDTIGFGELCEVSDFDGDTLNMTSRSDGNIINYHEWSPVF